MKRLVLMGLFALNLLSFSAYALDFKPADPVVKLMPLLKDNIELLELSAEQKKQVGILSQKIFQDLEYLNAQYHELKTELKEALYDAQPQKQKAMQLANEIAKLEKQRLQLSIECAESLKTLLTAKQHQDLIEFAKL